jgi:hypothetical protein
LENWIAGSSTGGVTDGANVRVKVTVKATGYGFVMEKESEGWEPGEDVGGPLSVTVGGIAATARGSAVEAREIAGS